MILLLVVVTFIISAVLYALYRYALIIEKREDECPYCGLKTYNKFTEKCDNCGGTL